jgi:hypothetical protein
MKLKGYQWGELIGMFLLLASTAAQIFYVDPLKREIEWRLAAFSMQQNAQVQTKATYDSRIAVLKSLNAPPESITASITERDATLAKYKTADANVADYLLAKEPVENYLQIGVLALFALGTLLAGIARAIEMRRHSG